MKFPVIELVQVVEREVPLLRVTVPNVYTDDFVVNEQEPSDRNEIPFCKGETWDITIRTYEGSVVGWPKGTKLSVHIKAVDTGTYKFMSANYTSIKVLENEYVPSILSPGGNGYGDYIIMEINEGGYIQNWNFRLLDELSEVKEYGPF